MLPSAYPASSATLEGPRMGMVFDSSAPALRPILGIQEPPSWEIRSGTELDLRRVAVRRRIALATGGISQRGRRIRFDRAP
jgi:hypothetical protein